MEQRWLQVASSDDILETEETMIGGLVGVCSAPGRAVCGGERINRVVVGQDRMYLAIHAEGEAQVREESAEMRERSM